MKKLICICFALLASTAWAEWVYVAENKWALYFIDPTTIRRDGNLRKVWAMTNLRVRDKDGELSRRTRVEYDCKQERARTLFISTHVDPMAQGETLINASLTGEWGEVPPNSVQSIELSMVCAK